MGPTTTRGLNPTPISLDFGPAPETALGLSQERSREPATPDALADLSRQSGLPSRTLASLSPGEQSSLADLEATVSRVLYVAGRPGSGVSDDDARAAVVARNGVRDGVAAGLEPDPLEGLQLADARVRIERPAAGAPAAPADARLDIRDGTVTIESDIYIYGSGATAEVARTFERQIQAEWGQNPQTGRPWTYTDPDSGRTYAVRFDVDVRVYDPDDPARTPGLFSGRFAPWNRDNFIEVTAENGRSFVRGGDEGQWRAHGRGGRTLADDNPAAHEFGHILGLPDRYVEGGGPQRGWDGNIMAMPAGQGVVQQRDIDTLVRSHIDRYERAGSPETFRSTINP